ncbi:MAG TPA: radical SAM protein [Elusimicrobiales bacterium]|nr:radical SAM protein [Elusimicrobiales bacterium]
MGGVKRPAGPEPFLVEIFLTGRCNMDCTYCAARYMIHAKEPGLLTFEQLKRAAEVIAADRVVRRKHGGRVRISFTGGEPMLEFALIEKAVRHMRARYPDWEFDVSTNGTLLTPERLEFFLRNDVGLSVSLDGFGRVNDSHRRFVSGKASAFGVVERSLRAGLDDPRYRDLFHVAATLTSRTIGDLPGVVSFFRERTGLRELEIALEAYEDWGPPARAGLRRVLRGLGRRCAAALERGEGAEEAFREFIFTQAKGAEGRELTQKALTLFYDGRFYPCDFVVKPPLEEEYCVGDLERGLDHGRLEALERLPLFREIERKCEFKSGLLSPVERYYWGMVHGYSRAGLDAVLLNTSEVNRIFHEELGPYLRLQRAYARLFMSPGFGDFVHAPKFAGSAAAGLLRLAVPAGAPPARLRAAADWQLHSPGAGALRLAAADGRPARAAAGDIAFYAMVKSRMLGKRSRVELEADGGGRA